MPCFLSHLTLYTQPLNMELIQGSETSANYNLTPGKYPEENIQQDRKCLPQEIYLFIYLFVHKLFNSAVRNSDSIVLKDWTIESNDL